MGKEYTSIGITKDLRDDLKILQVMKDKDTYGDLIRWLIRESKEKTIRKKFRKQK